MAVYCVRAVHRPHVFRSRYGHFEQLCTWVSSGGCRISQQVLPNVAQTLDNKLMVIALAYLSLFRVMERPLHHCNITAVTSNIHFNIPPLWSWDHTGPVYLPVSPGARGIVPAGFAHRLAERWLAWHWDLGLPLPQSSPPPAADRQGQALFPPVSLGPWQPLLWETHPGRPSSPWHAPPPINIASPFFLSASPEGWLLRVRSAVPRTLRLHLRQQSFQNRAAHPKPTPVLQLKERAKGGGGSGGGARGVDGRCSTTLIMCWSLLFDFIRFIFH